MIMIHSTLQDSKDQQRSPVKACKIRKWKSLRTIKISSNHIVK